MEEEHMEKVWEEVKDFEFCSTALFQRKYQLSYAAAKNLALRWEERQKAKVSASLLKKEQK